MDWRVLCLVTLTFLSSCGKESTQRVQLIQGELEEESAPPPRPLCASGSLPEGIVRNVDYLNFPNFGFRGIGRCRGHALVSQRLLYFMRFKPQLPREWDCDYDRLDCQAKFREKLNQVSQNKVVIIHGYDNLAELSTDLPLRTMIRSEILKIPHRYTAVPIKLNDSSPRQVAIFKELQRRVRLNHLTYVSLKGVEVGQHGVLTYSQKRISDREMICVRDSNIIPESGKESCQNYFYLQEGMVYYHRDKRGESVVRVEVFSDEEVRLNSFRQSLCLARKQGSL